MSTSSYTADLADMSFVLFEQLKVHEILASHGAYGDFDRASLEGILSEARRVAEEVLSPLDRVSDAEGVTYDGESVVSTPAVFKEGWQAIASGGWVAVAASPELGGAGLPHAIATCTTELFFAAAPAFMMYPGLTATAGRMLTTFAPERLRQLVVQKLFAGEWAGTMCLTEAGAGSDVGANRCKATPTAEPGIYLLEGEKIFISGGDQDLTSNIMHVILARTPDAPAGTRGLSIFLVPKFWFDAEGNLGERNGARVGGIEHKMGINGSATCTLLLGDRTPCRGWLLGEEGDGMSIMFHMMNEARIGVGVQSVGIAANAYNNSLSYSQERRQGSSIDRFKEADAPRVPIVEHPDVRRMLLLQKCQIEAMRSLIYRLAFYADLIEHAPEDQRDRYRDIVDLLTPIAKAHVSDVSFECAVTALQCFGGYGFIREYPVEQHVRDLKICSIYEGTNGIQAMDLLGRKLRQKGGALFMGWMQEAATTCAAGRAAGFAPQADAIDKAVQQLGATAMHLGGMGGSGKLEAAMLNASNFLRQMGIIVLAIESLDQAIVASRSTSTEANVTGKALNLRFYVSQVLPFATALGKVVQGDDGAALDDRLFV